MLQGLAKENEELRDGLNVMLNLASLLLELKECLEVGITAEDHLERRVANDDSSESNKQSAERIFVRFEGHQSNGDFESLSQQNVDVIIARGTLQSDGQIQQSISDRQAQRSVLEFIGLNCGQDALNSFVIQYGLSQVVRSDDIGNETVEHSHFDRGDFLRVQNAQLIRNNVSRSGS